MDISHRLTDAYTKIAPGIFTFHTTETSGTFYIHNQILMQTLRLKNVRVQFDIEPVNSFVPFYISIRFPWLSTFQLIDGVQDRFDLVIPLSGSEVTLYQPDLPVYMMKDAHESFEYRILDDEGDVPDNLVSCTLQFEFTYSKTS